MGILLMQGSLITTTVTTSILSDAYYLLSSYGFNYLLNQTTLSLLTLHYTQA